MTTPSGNPTDNAETLDSRPESDGVVTDSRDRSDAGTPSIRAEGVPVDVQIGELRGLIIWKINHIRETGCITCHLELAELLRDWHSLSESREQSEQAQQSNTTPQAQP